MKLIIHATDREATARDALAQDATERKEYIHLSEREMDDLPRAIRSEERTSGRAMLGQASVDESAEQRADELSPPEMLGGYSAPDEEILAEPEAYYLDESEPDETEADEAEGSWKHSRWPAVLFVLALLSLSAVWYLASRSDNGLRLSRVKVEGAALLSNEEILHLAGINYSVPFYQINLKQIEERLLTHSLIRTAHVRRELDPATLVLSVEERQPVALLRADSTGSSISSGNISSTGNPLVAPSQVPLRSSVVGETYIIDRDGLLLRPKLIAGLRDPSKIMQVPLLSGVSAKDTMGFQAMAKLVSYIASLDSGALKAAIGELHRTPTGAYVIYTSETETPIFLGSPFDREFHTALEEQRDSTPARNTISLFYRQLNLLAKVWKSKLQSDLRTGHPLYVDARFSGQIILKHKFQPARAGATASQTALQSEPNHAHYATNANK